MVDKPIEKTNNKASYLDERRSVWAFLTRFQGGNRMTLTDVLTYSYLIIGTFVMFLPVVCW